MVFRSWASNGNAGGGYYIDVGCADLIADLLAVLALLIKADLAGLLPSRDGVMG